MHKKPIKVDLASVVFRTGQNKHYLKKYKKYFDDPDKHERLDSQQCIICYYRDRIGGSMMTETNCGLCDKRMMFSNTNADVLCHKCAKDHRLCKHCCADMEYKERRKL